MSWRPTREIPRPNTAADKGLKDSQYHLAICYSNGEGVTKNLRRAAELFKLAADQGHKEAEQILSWSANHGRD